VTRLRNVTGGAVASAVRRRADIGALLLVVLVLHLLPRGGPLGIDVLGAGSGARLALEGLGIVLVLRSNRIINFAQVQMGAVSGLLFLELVRHAQFVVWLHQACSSCVSGLPSDSTFLQTHPMVTTALLRHDGALWLQLNFWLSAVVALAVGPLLGWLSYQLVVSRFNQAPRLIATVVTIGLAQVFAAVAGWLPNNLFNDNPNPQPGAAPAGLGGFSLPFPDVSWTVSPARLHTGDIATFVVVAAVVIALTVFFRVTRAGVRMRGVADNPQRAATLGISVRRVASVSWLMAGGLSSLAAMLGVLVSPGASNAAQGILDVETLVVILAAVVFARMRSLPLVAVAAVALGVLGAVLQWNTNATVAFDGALVVLLGVAMALQRQSQSRTEQEESAAYLGAREARPVPPELRDVGAVVSARHWVIGAVAVVVLGMPFVISPSQLDLAVVALVAAMVGLSLLVLTGWAGQISLGQFAFAAVGGWVATCLGGSLGMPMPVSVLAGGLAGGAVATAVGLPALRLRGTYLAVITLAFAVAVSSVLLNPEFGGRLLPSTLNRPLFLGIDFEDERVYFYMVLVILAVAAAAVAGLRRSGVARVLIACRDNEQAGQSFGVNLLRARLQAFALSGFLAALAGGLLAYHQHGIQAAGFTPDVSVAVFLMVVIGGLGSIMAPLLGAAYYGVLLLFPQEAQVVGTGLGLVLVLMFAPGGLGALALRVRDSFLRQVALRHRILVPSLLADRGGDALRPTAAPIAPRARRGGGTAYLPSYYRLDGAAARAAAEQMSDA
jgi:branched-chain amino acid transport system permease protein